MHFITAFKWTRVVFALANFIFLLLGLTVVGVGLYVKVGNSEYLDLFQQYEFDVASALLIAASVIVIITAIIGYMGIGWQNEFLLFMYVVMVIIIFAVEITSGALAFKHSKQISADIKVDLLASMRLVENHQTWDSLQQKYTCCGVEKKEDWYGILDRQFVQTLPDSCCLYFYAGCGSESDVFEKGCFKELKDVLDESSTVLGIVAVVVGVLQFLLLILACVLIYFMRQANKQKAKEPIDRLYGPAVMPVYVQGSQHGGGPPVQVIAAH